MTKIYKTDGSIMYAVHRKKILDKNGVIICPIKEDTEKSVVEQIVHANWTLDEALLDGMILQTANLSHASLEGASFVGADLTDAKLDWANCRSANFTGADLSWVKAFWTKFAGANFMGASLLNANFAASFCALANFTKADCNKADFTDASLSQANFEGAKLTHVKFAGAVMTKVNLYGANLDYASGIPFLPESNGIKGDLRLAAQLAKHFCLMDFGDSIEANEAQKALKTLSKMFPFYMD